MSDLSKWKDNCYTVRELAAELMKLPGDMIVIMAKDAEGNGFSPLGGVVTGHYEPTSTWSGEILASREDWNPEEYGTSSYESYIEGSEVVIILDPVN